jgi:hypothetical protein
MPRPMLAIHHHPEDHDLAAAVRELSERVARLEDRSGWLGLPADLVDADMRHWAHEMLAERFTLRQLHDAGHELYAQLSAQSASVQAPTVSLDDLKRWTGGGDPSYYGRAYVLGTSLVELLGWDESPGWSAIATSMARPTSTPG